MPVVEKKSEKKKRSAEPIEVTDSPRNAHSIAKKGFDAAHVIDEIFIHPGISKVFF